MPSKHTPNVAHLGKQANQLALVRQAVTDWQQSDNPFLRLGRRLATTLSLETQIGILAEVLTDLVPFDQLTYRHQIGKQDFVYNTGLGGQHRCDYRLILEGVSYGSLTLTRRQRFADEELEAIEQSIGVAICQIRNACQFATVQQAALTDALTAIPNKRALDEALVRACCISDRHREDFTLLLCDLDHFKQVNDNHGHVIGDHLLKAAAAQIEQAIRSSDALYRFGGEEFAILLPHTLEQEARVVAERIRESIAGFSVDCGDTDVSVTCSLGVATRQRDESPEQWLARADEALYRAKDKGRNQTRVSDRIA